MRHRSFHLGAATLALALAALACSFSFSTAEVQNLRIAKDQDGNTTAAQFKPEEDVFLVGDLAKAADDTRIKATWIAVSAEGVDANKVIWEHEERRGNGKFSIKLAREAGSRPMGKYKVDLYLNGELNKSIEFEMLRGEPTPTPEFMGMPGGDPNAPLPGQGGGGLINVHTSRDEADTQPASVFAQKDQIYTHFVLDVPEGQAVVRGALMAVAVDGMAPETVVAEYEQNFPAGAQWIRFNNSLPWMLGTYRVDLAVNGVPVQALQVQIGPTNTSGAQIVNVFSSLDKDGQQPANVFPTTSSVFVHFSLTNAGAGANVQGVMVTRDVQGLQPNSQITEAGGQLTDGSYWFEYFYDGPWPVGGYSVFIYINGQFVQQVDVQIQ